MRLSKPTLLTQILTIFNHHLILSVFGPLKKMVNSAGDAWMGKNPAKTMTIYNVPCLLRTALPTAALSSNIQAGFRSTGMWPFSLNVVQEHEFIPFQVSDQRDPASVASACLICMTASTSDILCNLHPVSDLFHSLCSVPAL